MKKSIIVSAVTAAALAVTLTACGRKTYDVTKTMEVRFEGCDGYGECELDNKYGWVSDIQDYYRSSKGYSADQIEQIGYVLEMTVSYDVEPEEGLSNGDTVTITPKIDSLADEYAFDLVGEPVTVTVEGLEKVEEFDPFESLTVTFDGIAPNGTVKLETSDNDIYFEGDKGSGLSNGDTITVTAQPSGNDMNSYVSKHGKTFSQTEKTYTVEGLAYYAAKLDEIPDDAKEKNAEAV